MNEYIVLKQRSHHSSIIDGVSYSEWECSDCGALFLFGPGTPTYCPQCGEAIDLAELLPKENK